MSTVFFILYNKEAIIKNNFASTTLHSETRKFIKSNYTYLSKFIKQHYTTKHFLIHCENYQGNASDQERKRWADTIIGKKAKSQRWELWTQWESGGEVGVRDNSCTRLESGGGGGTTWEWKSSVGDWISSQTTCGKYRSYRVSTSILVYFAISFKWKYLYIDSFYVKLFLFSLYFEFNLIAFRQSDLGCSNFVLHQSCI